VSTVVCQFIEVYRNCFVFLKERDTGVHSCMCQFIELYGNCIVFSAPSILQLLSVAGDFQNF